MKKKIYLNSSYLLITIIALIFSSCSSVLDEQIESTTIEASVQKIKEKYPDLDSLKLNLLENLVTFNKGREAYIISVI